MSAFFKAIGAYRRSVRNVMVLGGGRISLYLGSYLIGAGIRVKIIEREEEHCEVIKEILPKAEVLLGDGTDPKLLEEEGIRTSDAFVALTGSDQNNIITSMFARRSGAGKVITKVNEDTFRLMAGDAKLGQLCTAQEQRRRDSRELCPRDAALYRHRRHRVPARHSLRQGRGARVLHKRRRAGPRRADT